MHRLKAHNDYYPADILAAYRTSKQKGSAHMKKPLSDRQLMEQLYELYEQKMLMAAYSILQDYHQAEDAVQEAFIKFSRHLSKFNDITSRKSRNYILTTIKSVSIDMYRKNQVNSSYFFSTENDNLESAIYHPTINEALQIENEIYIKELIGRLPLTYKEIINDYYYKQLSIAEIAQSLKISEAAARKRLQRAVATLKNMTGDEHYEYKII